MSLVKLLPAWFHAVADYLAAALLIGAPFALHFASAESGLAVFYVVMGVAVLAVSLVTNYQYSPKPIGNDLGTATPAAA